MKKIAIIGASHFQQPLIEAAKKRGIETHVFAWKCGDIGEKTSDFFYPISITEKEQIAQKCAEIGVDGVCTIASDLGNITVSYVADKLGLVSNSVNTVDRTTNKAKMRKSFAKNGDPSPKSVAYHSGSEIDISGLRFPLIVKPADRSGSRGVTKVKNESELLEAIKLALDESFGNTVMIEEFAEGDEYSVEFISWEGKHYPLAITKKYTTGAPDFIETAHTIPGDLDQSLEKKVLDVVKQALDHLGVEYGASHSELKIDRANDNRINIIEIGSRMGGDCIGSHLVKLATDYDFVDAVIDISLGIKPPLPCEEGCQKTLESKRCSGIRFLFDEADLDVLKRIEADDRITIEYESPVESIGDKVRDSSTRHGYCIFTAPSFETASLYAR